MSVPIFRWNKLTANEQARILSRPVSSSAESLRRGVQEIVQDVRENGDESIRRLTLRFDNVELDQIKVSEAEFNEAEASIDELTHQAMVAAIRNIEVFHRQQKSQALDIEVAPGIRCMRQSRPIERVGLYVPGGTAPLPSTVIMLAVPARLAACPIKVLCTPPNREGKVNRFILAAARLAGIDQVYKVGGAQAIAAMAFGTETVPKVDKIFGPGNSWVTEAKLQVAQDPLGASYDMPAGPSEVLVIADHSANPSFIAADLLSQAEHGHDSQSILLTDSLELAEKTKDQLRIQTERLSRQSIIKEALQHCRLLVCEDMVQCFELSNQYGPEHLIVQLNQAEQWINQIINAGSVFLGHWSPESVGDYASGTNHVLPTYGFARSMSGLSLDSFMKQITFQQLSTSGLQSLGPIVETLASLEGLEAHRQAVSIRLAALGRNEL